jgi:hypothetical protein
MTSWLDKKLIDGWIDRLGMALVVVSKAVELFDKLIVDGVVGLVARISESFGNFIRLFHTSRVQLQFFWAVFLLILFVLGFELF